jgi:alkaline phosphatase D
LRNQSFTGLEPRLRNALDTIRLDPTPEEDSMAPASRATRRQFLKQSAAGAVVITSSGLPGIVRAQQAPPIIGAAGPQIDLGLQIGDVLADRAIIWSRSDRPARMLVEWSTSPSFSNAVRVRGPHALEVSDLTARVDLVDLPEDSDVFVRVKFQDLDGKRTDGAPALGHFRTAPRRGRDIRFVWSGDTAGQGWGINLEWGGMKIYKTMLEAKPDFFIHSGDNIYADGPMADAVPLPDGTIWRNAFLDEVPSKRKVAETLDEYRGAYRYNLHDANLRAFNALVPQIWQWDDHEVLNNWSDAKDLGPDARYTEKRMRTLAARAGRAFLEYTPMRFNGADESERVYRKIPYGRELDVFVLDMRSYRGPNSYNQQTAPSDETAYLGRAQLDWLKSELRRSTATWKVIASDMPIGILVADGVDPQGRPQWENSSNGDGPVLGREFEIAEVLRAIKRHDVRNVVWLTADVHYCAALQYDPAQAQFKDFNPFWEFVAGPLNAGTFGPNGLDNTFGPKVVFQKAPPAGQSNLPPSAGLQFFGQVDIDPRSLDMVVALRDVEGNTLFSQRLEAARGRRE